MKLSILLTLPALAGCVMSPAGLGKGSVERSWTSAKSPQQVSGCLASKLMGTNPVFQDETGHYVVVRNNGYGIPVVRYDVYDSNGTTNIELRSSIGIGRGSDKLESCL